MSEEHFTDI